MGFNKRMNGCYKIHIQCLLLIREDPKAATFRPDTRTDGATYGPVGAGSRDIAS